MRRTRGAVTLRRSRRSRIQGVVLVVLQSLADELLYQAKQQGRNRVCLMKEAARAAGERHRPSCHRPV